MNNTEEKSLFEKGKELLPRKYINIPDPKFKEAILKFYKEQNIVLSKEGEITKEEALKLFSLSVRGGAITSLKGIKHFRNLHDLHCDNNLLTDLDISNNTALRHLDCSNNKLTKLNLSNHPKLYDVDCSKNQLPSLNVSKILDLNVLRCADNQLTNIDLSKNIELIELRCSNNSLISLDVSKNEKLHALFCEGNKLSNLDFSLNHIFRVLECDKDVNVKTYLDKKPLSEDIYKEKTRKEDKEMDRLLVEYEKDNPLSNYDNTLHAIYLIEEQKQKEYITIPDKNFKEYLLAKFDKDGDGKISIGEALDVKHINCFNLNISSLEGLEHFKNLETLVCSGNKLSSIDISMNVEIGDLECKSNQLTDLDISKNTKLSYLDCSENQLTRLNVSNNPDLSWLICNDNSITDLDVSQNPELKEVFCQDNKIAVLNVSENKGLETLDCSENNIEDLNLLNNPKLKSLDYDSGIKVIKPTNNLRP